MRIAQVAPLFESVPPRLYGGTERVVSYLTEELIRLGHDVTLFASGDSRTRARLVSPWPHALRLSRTCLEWVPPFTAMLEQVAAHAERFDLIHSHIDCFAFPVLRRLGVPHVTTLHGRLDLPELQPVFREYHDIPVVSISNAQRDPVPFAAWAQKTVYHGLPKDLFKLQPRAGSYLAFLGRLSEEKRPDRAIEIAERAGLPLKIAAKIDPRDEGYFKSAVKPLLDRPCVAFLGEIGDEQKAEFLANAYALLFPIDWPEPFGMVLIEAMACGTPVIAYRAGSVPELIEDGVTGYVVDGVPSAVEAVRRVPGLSRARIRDVFESRFTAERMARDYVSVYQSALARRRDDRLAVIG